MRPMIRLGNLNARPSCPAAAPGSTVWVYLYAAGHRDMPGDSPAGNGRLSGIKAQSGKIADACVKEKPPPSGSGRRTDGTAWGWEFSRQEPERHADSQGTHRCHRKPPPRGADSGQTARRGQEILLAGTRAAYRFTGHTPVPSQTVVLWSGQRADSMAWGRNLHLHEPDSPEQHIFTEHTPATQQNRRPENRRRLDLRAAQAMR